jgi:hypothetical protein
MNDLTKTINSLDYIWAAASKNKDNKFIFNAYELDDLHKASAYLEQLREFISIVKLNLEGVDEA